MPTTMILTSSRDNVLHYNLQRDTVTVIADDGWGVEMSAKTEVHVLLEVIESMRKESGYHPTAVFNGVLAVYHPIKK